MGQPETLPPLGFLAVEVEIFRPPGDPFNERTWEFPLIHEKVVGTSESQIVTKDAYDESLIDRFVEAAEKLATRGAVGVITSCGFLAMAQKRFVIISRNLVRQMYPSNYLLGYLHAFPFQLRLQLWFRFRA